MKLEIRATASHFSHYQELVDSDWNGKTFADVLQLLWEVVVLPSGRDSGLLDWLIAFKKNPVASPVSMPDELEHALSILTGFFHSPRVAQPRNEPVAKKSQITMQAEATISSLLIQSLCTLSGETGFFRDLQSLLYLNAVHYLLPKLKKSGATRAYQQLVKAMDSHSVLVWWDEPAHMFYLRAAMMGQLGLRQHRLECLRQALSATPMTDHSFMTKANAYWGELLEGGDRKQVLQWLIGLSRNVPEAYASEVADMMAETAGATVGHR